MNITVILADPAHALPWPDVPGRIVAGPAPFEVSPSHPFWAALLRDGSIIPAPAKPAAKAADKKDA
jgi:hypothetical protein